MRVVIVGQQAFGKSVLEAFVARGDTIAGVFAAPEKPGSRPDPLVATPAAVPISSKRNPPRFRNKKLGVASLATKMSSLPSPSRSAMTTPRPGAGTAAMPEETLMSLNVPSPLLR